MKKRLYLGTKIQTKKSFVPKDANGKKVELDRQLNGTIIGRFATFYQIDFGEKFQWTHSCSGLLDEDTGYALDIKDFKEIKEGEFSKKETGELLCAVREAQIYNAHSLLANISEQKAIATNGENRLMQLDREITRQIAENEKVAFNIKELEEEKRKSLNMDYSLMEKRIGKVLSNKKIQGIQVLEEPTGLSFVVTTSDLFFTSKTRDLPRYNLGAYKLKIPFDYTQKVLAINYKKQTSDGEYHHPCVKSDGGMCLGGTVEKELKKLRQNGMLPSVIMLLINFLEEPEYGTPFVDARLFAAAQQVKKRPRDLSAWFLRETWRSDEFDRDKFNEEYDRLTEHFTGRRRDRMPDVYCPECHCTKYNEVDGVKTCNYCNNKF